MERHPWEHSRVSAIERILRSRGIERADAILDYGCGDAYTGRILLDRLGAGQLVGVDLHLDEEQSRSLAAGDARVELLNTPAALGTRQFDLILLCDVIEHVEDDRGLLSLVKGHLREHGRVMVTVPAFQALFTEHDRALRHHRRYSLRGLETSVTDAGLELDFSGYLFSSLLPVRGAEKLIELMGRRSRDPEGLGGWRAGPAVTRVASELLRLDNTLLIELAMRGIKLPGLSAWALCH